MIVVLVFLYFILNPDKVPAFLRRDNKQSQKEETEETDSDGDDDDCSAKVAKLVK